MWKVLVFIVTLVSARNVKRDYNEAYIEGAKVDYGVSYRSVVPTGDLLSEPVIENDSGLARENIYANSDINEDIEIREIAPLRVEPRHIDVQYRQNNVDRNNEYVNTNPEIYVNQQRDSGNFGGRKRMRFYEAAQINDQSTLNGRDPYQNGQYKNLYGNRDQLNSAYREENLRNFNGNEENIRDVQNDNGRNPPTNANNNQRFDNVNRNEGKSYNVNTSVNIQGLNNNGNGYGNYEITESTERNEYVPSYRPTKPHSTSNCGHSKAFNNVCYERLRKSQNSRQGTQCYEGTFDLVCIDKDCKLNPKEHRSYEELKVYSHENKLVICYDNSCFDKDCKSVQADTTSTESNNNNNTNANEFKNSSGQITQQSYDEDKNRNRQGNGSKQNSSRSYVDEEYRPTKNVNTRTDVSGDSVDDKWVWGMTEANTTESPTTTTPDLDDRAAFTGDKCPTGKIKVNNMCVDKDR